MRKRIYKKNAWGFLSDAIVPVLFTLVIICMIIYGLQQTERSSKSEGLRILDDSIRRAVVMCYAVEGRYPDTVRYIEENYGIHIDRTRYAVHYNIFASNLFPDITVIDLEPVS